MSTSSDVLPASDNVDGWRHLDWMYLDGPSADYWRLVSRSIPHLHKAEALTNAYVFKEVYSCGSHSGQTIGVVEARLMLYLNCLLAKPLPARLQQPASAPPTPLIPDSGEWAFKCLLEHTFTPPYLKALIHQVLEQTNQARLVAALAVLVTP
jgi:hypothetical protein